MSQKNYKSKAFFEKMLIEVMFFSNFAIFFFLTPTSELEFLHQIFY